MKGRREGKEREREVGEEEKGDIIAMTHIFMGYFKELEDCLTMPTLELFITSKIDQLETSYT